ncbi:VOC family protein [Actinoplanes philippinensis]|uniref:VOC family protein n=1 Tax=Actinoplanes philippinensis TaxID=35752 RepID=UPI0033F48788
MSVRFPLVVDIRAADRAAPHDVRRKQVDAEVDRLCALGAAVIRRPADPGAGHYGVTPHDPEGNEFCVA